MEYSHAYADRSRPGSRLTMREVTPSKLRQESRRSRPPGLRLLAI